MTGATGQLRSVKSRLKRNLVQRDQERKVRNGNVQMTNSTTLSGRPSLPVTRYPKCSLLRLEAGTFRGLIYASVPVGFQPEEPAFSRTPLLVENLDHPQAPICWVFGAAKEIRTPDPRFVVWAGRCNHCGSLAFGPHGGAALGDEL